MDILGREIGQAETPTPTPVPVTVICMNNQATFTEHSSTSGLPYDFLLIAGAGGSSTKNAYNDGGNTYQEPTEGSGFQIWDNGIYVPSPLNEDAEWDCTTTISCQFFWSGTAATPLRLELRHCWGEFLSQSAAGPSTFDLNRVPSTNIEILQSEQNQVKEYTIKTILSPTSVAARHVIFIQCRSPTGTFPAGISGNITMRVHSWTTVSKPRCSTVDGFVTTQKMDPLSANTGNKIVKSDPSLNLIKVVESGVSIDGTNNMSGVEFFTAFNEIKNINGNIVCDSGDIKTLAGNIISQNNITATTGNITSSAGSITAQNNITSNTGNITASLGDIKLSSLDTFFRVDGGIDDLILGFDTTDGGFSLKQTGTNGNIFFMRNANNAQIVAGSPTMTGSFFVDSENGRPLLFNTITGGNVRIKALTYPNLDSSSGHVMKTNGSGLLSLSAIDNQHANIYITASAATVISVVDTPVKINGTYAASNLSGFTESLGRLTATFTGTKRFQAVATISVNSAASLKKFSFYIGINGSKYSPSRTQQQFDNTDPHNASVVSMFSIGNGDIVDVMVECNSSPVANMTANFLNFNLIEIQ